MIESVLSQLGLSEKEVLVYLEIVKSKNTSVLDISRRTKLPRATVYYILEKLLDKGLIIWSIMVDKRTFQPADFSKFISKLKEQENLAFLAETELKKLKVEQESDYKIEIFEGREGLKSYFDYVETLLKAGELKDYLVLGSSLKSTSQISPFLLPKLKNVKHILKNLDFRIILNQDVGKGKLKKRLKNLSNHKNFPENCKSTCTTVIFNDFAAFIFETTKIVVVRIKNKKVAETYRNQFNLIWKFL